MGKAVNFKVFTMPETQNTAIVIAPKHTDTPAWALGYPHWVTWTTRELKKDGSGRYNKVPTSASGHDCNAHDLKNHRKLTEVLAQYRRTHGTPDSLLFEQVKGKLAGIALDLPNAPTPFAYADDGAPLFLIALDFDSVKANLVNQTKLKAALALLPPHYRETSPSGTGLRVLVLCRVLVAAFNQGCFEVYSRGRFMTMTLRGNGEPSEVAVEVIDQIKAMYPRDQVAAPAAQVSSRFDATDLRVNDDIQAATNPPRSLDDLKAMLTYLPTSKAQGCGNEYWFKIVLAARDGWGNSSEVKQIVRDWCLRSPAEFDEAGFQKLWARASRADANNTGVGTIVFEAKQRGYSSTPEPEPQLLKPVNVFDVLTNPAPPPKCVWDGYLFCGVVALLGAHGGLGKSTIALMLAVCAALGRALFGVGTVQCNTVFASFEDGTGIVRHRLAGICQAWNINPADLAGKLHIVDGTANPELFSADHRSAGDTTATYAELCKLVQSTGAGLVVVDNASDSFGGDEINRRQVRAFMRALTQVARLTDCAVLLLAHVDKGTSRARKAEGGEGYSGSTAWHNSARSRLFMTRSEDGTLSLEHQKSNFGRMREPLTLTWPDSGLPMLASDAPDITGLTGLMRGRADDIVAAALLRIIAEFEGRGQYCNTAVNSRTHVHALLKSEPAFIALKLRPDDTKRIVTQCQRAKWIEPLDYRTADRKPHQRWTLTAGGRLFGLPAAAPSAPSAPSGIDGASLHMAQAAAPSAPSGVGGVGEESTHRLGAEDGAEQGSLSGAEPLTTDTTDRNGAQSWRRRPTRLDLLAELDVILNTGGTVQRTGAQVAL